jgi:sulfate transport system ATP-binding protein
VSISLVELTKRYEGLPVVNRLSLEIAHGEFFVLIGPSGSGKSTVLRMIAGLNTADEGQVLIHGQDVTGAPPQARGVGFVFQHYALFQHMSVAENVEFALSVRRVPSAARRARRDELLELVGLAGLGGRLPAQLSGGQQQRVALARALAHQPRVLLLDEPFGALDYKIRLDLRRALRRIQSELRITTIFVTHDQEEAFELADRVAVMNFGRLLEVGTPHELYQRPQTEFVATFLGTANLMVGQATPAGVHVGPLFFPAGAEGRGLADTESTQRVQVLFRPEDVALAWSDQELTTPQIGQGRVEQITFSGSLERLRLRLPPIAGVRPISPPVAFGEDGLLLEATRSQDVAQRFPLSPGDAVRVGVRRIHALVHPGLSILILDDRTDDARAAVTLGGKIARLAHARLTLLTVGGPAGDGAEDRQAAQEKLGGVAFLEIRASSSGTPMAVIQELERQAYDLVVMGVDRAALSASLALAQVLLRQGDHHLLLAPPVQAEPTRALVCVTGSEPGKEDVLFAGRFLRHLGARATLLSVVPPPDLNGELRERAQRFLNGGAKSLEVLGVPAQVVLRLGNVRDEISAQMRAGGHDLLILGAPLVQRTGDVSLEGVISQVIEAALDHPVLIVRSHYASNVAAPTTPQGRINIIEDIIP